MWNLFNRIYNLADDKINMRDIPGLRDRRIRAFWAIIKGFANAGTILLDTPYFSEFGPKRSWEKR